METGGVLALAVVGLAIPHPSDGDGDGARLPDGVGTTSGDTSQEGTRGTG